MTRLTEATQIGIGEQGTAIIPADLLRAVGGQPGAMLVASIEDGRLVLEPREAIVARLRAQFANVPAGVSLADELMAERRQDARREAAE